VLNKSKVMDNVARGDYLKRLLVASLSLSSVFLFLFLAWPACAQIVPCGGLPGQPRCTFADLLSVPVTIYNYMLGTAAAVFMAVIIWSGIRMMLHHVSESPESELVNAKFTLFRGITGFVIIAAAYTIVNLLIIGILGLGAGTMLCNLLACFFDFAVNNGCTCSLPTILTGS